MNTRLKLIHLYLPLVLLSIPTMAQSTFFKTYETEHNYYWPNVIEVNGNGFLICGRKYLTAGPESVPFVMKVNNTGELVNHTTKNTNADNISYYNAMFAGVLNNDSILIVGTETTFDKPVNAGRVFIDVLDENLNITELASYTYHGLQVSGSKNYIRLNHNTFIISNQIVDGNIGGSFIGGINLLKFKLPADSIASYTFMHPYGTGTLLFLRDLNHNTIDSRVDLYYRGLNPPDGGSPSFHMNHIIELDTALNYLGWRSHPGRFFPNLNISTIDDLSYLVTTTRSNYDEYNTPVSGIEVQHITHLNDTLGSTFYFTPDTTLYAGFGNNTVVLHDGAITAGMLNLQASSFPWQMAPIWIQLTRLDSELNILGQYYYGGDASYFVSEAIPTADGGAMITGLRYSYEAPSWRSRVFALKVDANGLVVGQNELNEPFFSEAILTPNPGQNMAKANIGFQHSLATLNLYDLGGRQVLEARNLANGDHINMSALDNGVYVYRFVSDGKLIGTGKWVKAL